MPVNWRDSPLILARYHSMDKLPRDLRDKVILRPEEEALLYKKNGEHEVVPSGVIDLSKKKVRKNYQSVLFWTKTRIDVPLAVKEKSKGVPEGIGGVVHLTVAISEENWMRMRDRIAAQRVGANIVDSNLIADILHESLRGQWPMIIADETPESLTEPQRRAELHERLKKHIGPTLNENGLLLLDPLRSVWAPSAAEQMESMLSERRQVMELQREHAKLQVEEGANKRVLKGMKKMQKGLAKKELAYAKSQMDMRHTLEGEQLQHEYRLKRETMEAEVQKIRRDAAAEEAHRQNLQELERIHAEKMLEIDVRQSAERTRIDDMFAEDERRLAIKREEIEQEVRAQEIQWESLELEEKKQDLTTKGNRERADIAADSWKKFNEALAEKKQAESQIKIDERGQIIDAQQHRYDGDTERIQQLTEDLDDEARIRMAAELRLSDQLGAGNDLVGALSVIEGGSDDQGCPNCGKATKETWTNCAHCGHSL